MSLSWPEESRLRWGEHDVCVAPSRGLSSLMRTGFPVHNTMKEDQVM